MKATDIGVALTPAMLAADSEESEHSIRHPLLATIVESSDDAIAAQAPPAEIPDSEEFPDAPRAGPRLKILIVDDNRDAADACAMLLELSGHHVQTAYTGMRGLDLAESFHPRVLLLDIGLPDLNGYELAAKIRSAPWGRGIILIAVTGWGQEEDRRGAFEAGCDHHLTKPVSVEAVESLLQSIGPTISDA